MRVCARTRVVRHSDRPPPPRLAAVAAAEKNKSHLPRRPVLELRAKVVEHGRLELDLEVVSVVVCEVDT